jgi:diadenosine tetraphosphate (Ap4A) HIT family hydrolase
MAALNFSIHPQLAQDTTPAGDLALARVLLMNDANYPWLILVPRRAGVVEIVDLARDDQLTLMREIALASRALKAVTACDKLNVAAIGNVVPQLHVHVVARRRADDAWPKPVWGAAPARPYDPPVRDALMTRLRDAFGADLTLTRP